MTWGRCPTHGPIQDAQTSAYGEVVLLWCRCGLECSSFVPDGFIEHADLVELQRTDRQPREDAEAPDAPEPTGSIEDYHSGGGYYDLPNGERVRGKAAALAAFDDPIEEEE